MMARWIAAKARAASASLPVAFIGSFHTESIAAQLRAQGIGYVVIEPRYNVDFSEKEQQEFEEYLYPTTRQSYLSRVARTNKGPVAPSVVEVQTYYTPLLRRASTRIAQSESAAATADAAEGGFCFTRPRPCAAVGEANANDKNRRTERPA